jgi:hypothetical protein
VSNIELPESQQGKRPGQLKLRGEGDQSYYWVKRAVRPTITIILRGHPHCLINYLINKQGEFPEKSSKRHYSLLTNREERSACFFPAFRKSINRTLSGPGN